jgi:hypothetical protein
MTGIFVISKNAFLSSISFLVALCLHAQPRINYGLLDKPQIGGLPVIQLPQPSTLQSPASINFSTNPLGRIQEQNNRIHLQGMINEQRRREMMAEIEQDLAEFVNKDTEERSIKNSYTVALSRLLKLNPDSFSISKAVYHVESAYFNNKMSEENFYKPIKDRVELVKAYLKREGLGLKDNLALNYGIQKMFSQKPVVSYAKNKTAMRLPTFGYDFEDFRGEKDYTKMFAHKALVTGKGQCHSLPLAYLILAEQLGAKAQLSLAPQHSFIQFKDKVGKTINFETTNGNLVSTSWLMQSGYITSVALQNKTYLTPLTSKQLYAQIISDLLLGYLSKHVYDDLAEQMQQIILKYNPTNLTALIVDVNVKRAIAKKMIALAGKPKEEDLPKFADAYTAYKNMQEAHMRVEATGYQDMPEEAYQRWLQSVEREKTKANIKSVQTKNTFK